MIFSRRHLKNWLLFFIGLFLFFYAFHQTGLQDLQSLWHHFQPFWLVPYLLVSFLILFGLVLRWKMIVDLYFDHISFWELLWYKLAGFFVSYITPSAKIGGEGVRIYFLMKEKHLDFDHAAMTVINDKIIELSTNGLYTIFAIFLFLLNFSLPKELRWLLVVIGVVIILLILYYYLRIFSNKPVFYPLMRLLHLDKLAFIRRNEIKIKLAEKKMILFHIEHQRTFIFAVLLSLGLLLLSLVEFKFLSLLFGYSLSLYHIFFILTFVGIAYMIPIPAALGVLESIQLGVTSSLGLGKSIGLGISILTRIRDSVWAFLGFFYLLMKGIKYRELLTKQSGELLLDPRVEYFKKWKVK